MKMDKQLTENLRSEGYLSTYVDKLGEKSLLAQFFTYARKSSLRGAVGSITGSLCLTPG